MSKLRDTSAIINGKWILLALLLTALATPFVTWGVLRKVEADMAVGVPALVWAERATWPAPPIKRTTLERAPTNYGDFRPNESKWRPFDFAVSPEVEAAVLAASALAAQPAEAFASAATGDQLRSLIESTPDVAYLPHLLGTWHRVNGDAAEAERWYSRAAEIAPAVILLRFQDATGRPVAGLPLGPVEISCDRVVDDPETDTFDGELDQTLKLVYPALETDERGAVYLPIFHTVYRASYLPQPEGYVIQYHQVEGWFQFPGRIGSPKPAVVFAKP